LELKNVGKGKIGCSGNLGKERNFGKGSLSCTISSFGLNLDGSDQDQNVQDESREGNKSRRKEEGGVSPNRVRDSTKRNHVSSKLIRSK